MVNEYNSMKTVLIGAGNLATRLAVALHEKRLTPACVYSRTEMSARQLSEQLPHCAYTTELNSIPTDGDLYIFAVKDSVLPDLLARMPANNGLWVHTAGSVDCEIFRPYSARYGVFYPMQTFSKEREVAFDNIPLFIEANSEADADNPSLSKRIFAEAGHLQLVADEIGKALLVQLPKLLLAHHGADDLKPFLQGRIVYVLELLCGEPDDFDGRHGVHLIKSRGW